MNEFLEWMKKNARVVLIGAVGLLILSVAVGFAVGRAKSKAFQNTRFSVEAPEEGARAGRIEGNGTEDLPEPIVPGFDEGISSYSFSLDRAEDLLKDMELLPVKISDLLEHRAADLQSDVKPFVFNNEEFDVLVRSDELAEP